MVRRKKTPRKSSFPTVRAVFARLYRTSLTNAATLVSRGLGGYILHLTNRIAHSGPHGQTVALRAGESRWAYLPILLAVVREKQRAFRTSTHALCVDVLRRRGPAGTRSPAAGSCAAPASFTVCHRCVEVQRRTIYHFHAPCCADSIACTRCRSAALSNAVSCRS